MLVALLVGWLVGGCVLGLLTPTPPIAPGEKSTWQGKALELCSVRVALVRIRAHREYIRHMLRFAHIAHFIRSSSVQYVYSVAYAQGTYHGWPCTHPPRAYRHPLYTLSEHHMGTH